MRCRWCDAEIPFKRVIFDSKYCCRQHRKLEREHWSQLALARLRQDASAQERWLKALEPLLAAHDKRKEPSSAPGWRLAPILLPWKRLRSGRGQHLSRHAAAGQG